MKNKRIPKKDRFIAKEICDYNLKTFTFNVN